MRGPWALPLPPRPGPKKPQDFFAALRSSRMARYPGCWKAGRAYSNICGTSFSSTSPGPSSVILKTPGMTIAPSRAIVVSPSSQMSTSSCSASRTSFQCDWSTFGCVQISDPETTVGASISGSIKYVGKVLPLCPLVTGHIPGRSNRTSARAT